jgi:hypothetical protein
LGIVGLLACGSVDGATADEPLTNADAPDPGGDEGANDVEVYADNDDVPPLPRAATGLPASKRFDLTQPSHDLFRNKPLHDNRVMQSFAFDVKNGRLFTAQLRNGTSGDDLCISQLDLSGRLLGAMHLDSAGHGVSIGVEPVGSDSYLWVETDSNNSTESGRGTALLRFKFENGKTPTGKKFLQGSSTITCATDPVNGRIAIRRAEAGKLYISVFPLASAAKGDFTKPLAHFPQPALSGSPVVFQGYTIYGQYLYTLDGTGQTDAANINSYVTAIDINTGKVKSRAFTKAGSTLVFREPEGMAVYRAPSGEVRLFLGFASHDKPGGSKRYANLFFKNVLID